MIVDEDTFLEHFGKKGMKWGVRKSYTNKQQKKADRLTRVASGKASVGDKLRVHGTSSTIGIARRGLKGNAQFRAEKLQEHIDRVDRGEKRVRDLLLQAGGTSYFDIAKGVRLRNG